MALPTTAQAAISAALTSDWKEAVRINNLLVKAEPANGAALNRLAYAYSQLGQHALAKAAYAKVLKLDPYNQIAIKHAKALGSARHKKARSQSGNTNHVSPLWFLEEPGKTKVVPAVNPAPLSTITRLTPGTQVSLIPRKHCIEIRSMGDNEYLAALPDDISFRLLRLIASGNRYQALVKGLDKKTIIVILREVQRGKKFAGQPSFTATTLSMPSDTHAPAPRRDEVKSGVSLIDDPDSDAEDNDQAESDEPNPESDHPARE
jgi:tetratricopeptide (TPR) repeat protein